MDNNRINKRMFNTMPEGKRGTGRRKLRWGDSVDHDMKTLGERNWRNLALHREEWRKLFNKARAHAGLSSLLLLLVLSSSSSSSLVTGFLSSLVLLPLSQLLLLLLLLY
jgi:hypothetical protein